jgi:tight adherence protein B
MLTMELLPVLMLFGGLVGVLLMLYLAFSGPSVDKAQTRRMTAVRVRHAAGAAIVEAQMRRVLQQRETRLDSYFTRLLPNPARIEKKLEATGKDWTIGKYALASIGVGVVTLGLLLLKGLPFLLALSIAIFLGIGLPYKVVSHLIAKRLKQFNAKFPTRSSCSCAACARAFRSPRRSAWSAPKCRGPSASSSAGSATR